MIKNARIISARIASKVLRRHRCCARCADEHNERLV